MAEIWAFEKVWANLAKKIAVFLNFEALYLFVSTGSVTWVFYIFVEVCLKNRIQKLQKTHVTIMAPRAAGAQTWYKMKFLTNFGANNSVCGGGGGHFCIKSVIGIENMDKVASHNSYLIINK